MPNIQRDLVDHVVAAIARRSEMDEAAQRLIHPDLPTGPVDLVFSPRIPRIVDTRRGIDQVGVSSVRRDYVELEARNSALGLAGELAVLASEERRLWTAGAKNLASRIEHVSKTRGDGLGYDVLSFEPDGREKFIEVKTTTGANTVPFFITNRELSVSQQVPSVYCLARVYDFPRGNKTVRKAGIYELRGALDQSCELQPDSYRAVPTIS